MLVFAQTISPLRMLKTVLDNYESLPKARSIPNVAELIYLENGVNLCLILYNVVVTIYMWRRSPAFPSLFTWQWGISVLFAVADVTLVSSVLRLPFALVFLAPDNTRGYATLLMTGLWVWYVWVSKRVANTFRPRLQQTTAHRERLEPRM